MNAKALYKKLSRNNTTEELWGIIPQPPNTCPMIDGTIEDVKSFRSELVNVVTQLKEYKEIPNPECHKKEHEQFLSDVANILDIISDWDDNFISLEKEMEKMRNYLTNLRSAANDYKDSLWDSIDRNININDHEEKIYQNSRYWPSSPSHKTVRNDNFKVEFIVEKINSLDPIKINLVGVSCDSCEISELYEELFDLVQQLSPANVIPNKLAEISNKESIEEWANSVFSSHISNVSEYFMDFCESRGYSKSLG